MSVQLFVGYFIALAACSTIAFAPAAMEHAAAPDTLEAEMSLPALPALPMPASPVRLHSRKIGLKHLQVAQAD